MNSSYLTGVLIFLSFIVSIYSYFFDENLLIFSGLCSWLSFMIFFISLQKKKLLLVLLFLSFSTFVLSLLNSFYINYYKIFTVNQYLITLLIGVGFLKLITITNEKDFHRTTVKGVQSFITTYFSIHLLASVINLSALILVADKMYKKSYLTNIQLILLTRSFATDAYWSPFFVAFAAAIVYMPNLNTSIILSTGISLAIISFIFTYFEIKQDKKNVLHDFEGYPISLDSLYLPFLLATFVLITNYYFPHIKIIILVSLFSFFLSLLILFFKYSIKNTFYQIKNHIIIELPKMKSEISLFLVAGLFGIVLNSFILGLNLELPFKELDWIVASGLLAVFILLGFIGIHPIITIAIFGDLLIQVNHTIVAIVFLMAWSTTVSTSPFSGANLTIVGRYNIDANRIFKLNIFYSLKMYLISVAVLFIVCKYLII